MLEKLLKKSMHIFGKKKEMPVITSSDTGNDLRQREKELFGEDRVKLQRLFEKWVVRESWLLHDEAIPLLLGIDPESRERFRDNENETGMDVREMGEHARHCIEQGLLPVINMESPEKEWRVKPVEVYKWAAVSRVELPEQLTMLMEFLQKAISENRPATASLKTGMDPHIERYDNDKEKVLGTALAILAANPDRYRKENGAVSAEKIVQIISEKGNFWFGDDPPGMTPAAMTDLINRWLRTIINM